MSVLGATDPLRPDPGGVKGWLAALALRAAPVVFALLRRVKPILRLGSTVVVTRYDDVLEVFRRDDVFDTPYRAHIEVLTGGEPFFLGLRDGAHYRSDLAAMQSVMPASDLPRLGDRAEEMAETIVDGAGGEIEVVDALSRKVTFDLYAEYFGLPQPDVGRLEVWSTRLFEFQFAGSPSDKALRAEVDEIAPAFRTLIDDEIARRKGADDSADDVLGRCLHRQREGDDQFTDDFIRTNLLCMMVGGPPQPPIVVPHAVEQLLRRPDALADARAAARAGEDARLWRIVREAMRFDPLAPALPRVQVAKEPIKLARGTSREVTVPAGATVMTAFASAMMDPRRLNRPQDFEATRREYEYAHFGHGLHECFGRHMNAATLARMLKPLLCHSVLERASGARGHLSKRGIFADRLIVCFR